MTPSFARLPTKSCYAVIFTAQRCPGDDGYEEMADLMAKLASEQPGYLGRESARDENGFGITVSYWESEEAIAAWKGHLRHKVAQERGKSQWYDRYVIRVARIEREYSGP